MFSRTTYKGYNIWYNPDKKEATITLLAKVLKTFKNLPKLVAWCHAKIWVNKRINW